MKAVNDSGENYGHFSLRSSKVIQHVKALNLVSSLPFTSLRPTLGKSVVVTTKNINMLFLDKKNKHIYVL